MKIKIDICNESNDIRTDGNKNLEINDIKIDIENNKENIDNSNIKSGEVINGDKVITFFEGFKGPLPPLLKRGLGLKILQRLKIAIFKILDFLND